MKPDSDTTLSGASDSNVPTRHPTLSDVARRAGVSKIAVSVVLNGANSATRVSEATRQRIIEVAAELNYRPNAAARSLARGRSNTIGVLFGAVKFSSVNAWDEYGATILQGIINASAKRDFNITLFTKSWYETRADATAYRDQQTDGIVVVAPEKTSGVMESLVQAGVRVVAVSCPASEEGQKWLSVDIDNVEAGYLPTKYLIALGHRRIAHLQGRQNMMSGIGRKEGWLRALAEAGIPFDPELLTGELSYSGSDSYDAVRRLLSLPDPPTAIVAANDLMAMAALNATRDTSGRSRYNRFLSMLLSY